MTKKSIDEKVEEKYNSYERTDEVFKLIDKIAKRFGIQKEYVMIGFKKGNPSYSLRIRISQDCDPIYRKEFLCYLSSKIKKKFKDISLVEYDLVRHGWIEEGNPF